MSHRAARIVRNLLELSRKCESRREFKSIQFVINRALEIKQHEFEIKNIECVTDWPRNLSRTMIYERQLALAILNMLTNAEQALEGCLDGDGAQESITRRINFNARSSAGNILIKIADNGPGIPPDCLERIFDLFYSTRGSQEGTGLGLSDCR